MMDLNQLRVFHAVCQARSFTKAAEAVHLTQPGVSKHIKQVEEYFGLPMFDRLGKKVALTEAGEILFAATVAVMHSVETAEQKIEDLKGLHGGRLALGASFPIGIYVLPATLAAFRRKYPEVEVTLDISLSERIGAKVLANKLDIGLVSHDVSDARLEAKEFMTDELVAIAPTAHRWAKKKSIRPQELPAETVILAARGAGTRAVLEERLKEKQIALKQVVEFGNIEGVKRAVEAGLGVSVQARSCVEREIAGGFLAGVRLTGMETRIAYYCVRRREKHLSNAARAFLAMLGAGAAR
jgi:DNA-binding transcriptional LysR family regulator